MSNRKILRRGRGSKKGGKRKRQRPQHTNAKILATTATLMPYKGEVLEVASRAKPKEQEER